MDFMNFLLGGNSSEPGWNPNPEIMDWRRGAYEALQDRWGGPIAPEYQFRVGVNGQTFAKPHAINKERNQMMQYLMGWGQEARPKTSSSPGLLGLAGKFF